MGTDGIPTGKMQIINQQQPMTRGLLAKGKVGSSGSLNGPQDDQDPSSKVEVLKKTFPSALMCSSEFHMKVVVRPKQPSKMPILSLFNLP